MKSKFIKTVLVLIFVCGGIFIFAKNYRKTILSADLTQSLNSVMSLAVEFHKLRVDKTNQDIKPEMDQLIQKLQTSIQSAVRQASLKPGVGQHIEKSLQSVQEGISDYVASSFKDVKPLQIVFKQLALLMQTYKLDPYTVFFCSRDRSTWVQEEKNKPRNPVNLNFKNCGKKVDHL